MFILEIHELQMRIKTKDDTARLRLKHTEVRCTDVEPNVATAVALCQHSCDHECADCGNCLLCCRCCPGEG